MTISQVSQKQILVFGFNRGVRKRTLITFQPLTFLFCRGITYMYTVRNKHRDKFFLLKSGTNVNKKAGQFSIHSL
jgi:hypothetical protein